MVAAISAAAPARPAVGRVGRRAHPFGQRVEQRHVDRAGPGSSRVPRRHAGHDALDRSTGRILGARSRRSRPRRASTPAGGQCHPSPSQLPARDLSAISARCLRRCCGAVTAARRSPPPHEVRISEHTAAPVRGRSWPHDGREAIDRPGCAANDFLADATRSLCEPRYVSGTDIDRGARPIEKTQLHEKWELGPCGILRHQAARPIRVVQKRSYRRWITNCP